MPDRTLGTLLRIILAILLIVAIVYVFRKPLASFLNRGKQSPSSPLISEVTQVYPSATVTPYVTLNPNPTPTPTVYTNGATPGESAIPGGGTQNGQPPQTGPAENLLLSLGISGVAAASYRAVAIRRYLRKQAREVTIL